MTTISTAIELYIQTVEGARSPRTARTYRNGLNAFRAALLKARLDPDEAEVSVLTEDYIKRFITNLKSASPATENLYLSAASGFYHFLSAERLADPNLPRLKELIARRARKQGRRLPQFPREAIEELISYAQTMKLKSTESTGEGCKTEKSRLAAVQRERLRNLRDRAFILLLADTGLRVSEACSLALGDVDFREGRLTVIGKGGDQAAVRISERALEALREYLQERQASRPAVGIKTKSLPLFTRHDRAAGAALKPLDSSSAWELVKTRAREAVGERAAEIHPHSFRHYFVTVVLLATHNLEITRRLARHKSITVTQRYAEVDPELDEEYHQIFNEHKKGNGNPAG